LLIDEAEFVVKASETEELGLNVRPEIGVEREMVGGWSVTWMLTTGEKALILKLSNASA